MDCPCRSTRDFFIALIIAPAKNKLWKENLASAESAYSAERTMFGLSCYCNVEIHVAVALAS